MSELEELEKTRGWQVALEYLTRSPRNQNIHTLAEKINAAIEAGIVQFETNRVIRKVATQQTGPQGR